MVEHKPAEPEGWFSWMWGSSRKESEPDDIIITPPKNAPSWLRQLTPDEKARLYNAIGYDANENVERAPEVRIITLVIFIRDESIANKY